MFERLMTNKMFALSVACLAVSAIVIVAKLPGVLGAIFAPRISDGETPTILQTSLEEHEQESGVYRERFIGRSIFFTPPAPQRQIVTRPEPVETVAPPEPEPEPDPVIPDEYGGPEILALLGDQVHVKGPKILKLGEEDAELGLTVLEFVPPWSVKVRWHKQPGNYAPGNYVVEMFQRDYEAVFSKQSDEEKPIQGLTQAEDETAAAVESARGDRDRREERRGVERSDRRHQH